MPAGSLRSVTLGAGGLSSKAASASASTPDNAGGGGKWGFNVARVRIGNASEYGQWVPTYGNAHRPDRFGVLLFE